MCDNSSMTKSAITPLNLCDTTKGIKMATTYIAGSSLINRKNGGYMIMEIIMALVVLGFIIHPTFVKHQNDRGDETTSVEWELPMAKLLAQVGDFQNLIDRSWEGMDGHFGYHGPSMGERAGRLMTASLQNGVVLMTAGFVDQQGGVTADFSNNAQNFQNAAEGMCTAYYDAAREGMAR